jgi:hypothetical protein
MDSDGNFIGQMVKLALDDAQFAIERMKSGDLNAAAQFLGSALFAVKQAQQTQDFGSRSNQLPARPCRPNPG